MRPEDVNQMLRFAPVPLREYVEALEREALELRELSTPTGQAKLRLESDVELTDLDEKRLGAFVTNSNTSRKAALDAYPRQGSARHRIVRALDRAPMTREEIAGVLHMPENTVRPRVVELMEGGWLVATSATRKTRHGSLAEVLELSEKGMAARASDHEPVHPEENP